MQNNFEINRKLPKVPAEYLLTESEILRLKCQTPDELKYGYGSFGPDNGVEELFTEYFDQPIAVKYQRIESNIPLHVDRDHLDYKYNYVYDLGGEDVVTGWKSSKDSTDFEQIIKCEKHVWYMLNVGKLHAVWGITRPRLSITIKIKHLQT